MAVTQSEEGEAGRGAEAMEECFLLSCYLRLAQPAFLYSPGPSVPAITNQNNATPKDNYRPLCQGQFLNWGELSWQKLTSTPCFKKKLWVK